MGKPVNIRLTHILIIFASIKIYMKNINFTVFYAIVLITLINSCVWSQSTNNSNKSETKKYEIGGQFTFLRRTDADTTRETFRQFYGTSNTFENSIKITELGLGGRFTYNFTKNIAIDAEANFFPGNKQRVAIIGVPIKVMEPGGRKIQVLFGPKIGIRKKNFGVFGKLRPGFIRLGGYEVIEQVGSQNQFFILSTRASGLKFFNVDVGGVAEYYPSRRTVFRVDVGDTIIRYGAQKPKEINPSFTRHNLQINVGFGFRF